MSSITLNRTLLKGVIQVPTSKSLAHRAIIIAGLCEEESLIRNVSFSKDIEATLSGMQSLGANIFIDENGIYIQQGNQSSGSAVIDAYESGSTLRFLIPYSLIHKNKVHFIGHGKLGIRPLEVYYDLFRKQNIKYRTKKDKLDLMIEGQLKADRFQIPGNISSQFITGLMIACSQLDQDSLIEVTSPLESEAYVQLTMDVLKEFGIVVTKNETSYSILGNQKGKACEYEVEGDFSQAAFFLVADVLGADITINNLNLKSHQADRSVIDILERMGAELIKDKNGYRMKAEHLHSIDIDASSCPDIIPVISLACLKAEGTSHIYNAKRLRYKECDRLKAICEVIGQSGGIVTEKEDEIMITGGGALKGGIYSDYNDHRMVMMEAVLAMMTETPVTIKNWECVSKSYPDFFEDYKKLGGCII